MCMYIFHLSFHFADQRWWLGSTGIIKSVAKSKKKVHCFQNDDAFMHTQNLVRCDAEWQVGIYQSFRDYVR